MSSLDVPNIPVPAKCLHCGNAQAELMPKLGDRSDYRCPTCGDFSVSGTTERLFELGAADPKTSSAIFVLEPSDRRRWLQPV